MVQAERGGLPVFQRDMQTEPNKVIMSRSPHSARALLSAGDNLDLTRQLEIDIRNLCRRNLEWPGCSEITDAYEMRASTLN
jgi:hypothetical protein